MMRDASSLLNERGVQVATVPAFSSLPEVWHRMKHRSDFKGWRDFQRSGVHALSKRQAKDLFRNVGLSVECIPGAVPKRWKTWAASTGTIGQTLFAWEYTLVGRPIASSKKVPVHSNPQQKLEDERTVPELQVGGSGR
jgi:hypothetical protein